jgi:hypothetical protein
MFQESRSCDDASTTSEPRQPTLTEMLDDYFGETNVTIKDLVDVLNYFCTKLGVYLGGDIRHVLYARQSHKDKVRYTVRASEDSGVTILTSNQ